MERLKFNLQDFFLIYRGIQTQNMVDFYRTTAPETSKTCKKY